MRFYYGWVIVAIAMCVQLLIVGSSVNAFGLFVIPVSDEFELSRADVNTGLIISNLGGAVIAPFLGRMIDTYPVRKIMTFCALVFSAGMVGLGLSHSVLVSALILAVAIPVGLGGVSQLGALTLVARWFQAQRGRAMALAVMGASLGTVIMAPTVGWLIHSVGWRNCLVILGLTLGVIFMVLIYFLREFPGAGDVEPQSAGATAQAGPPAISGGERALSTKQLLQLPLFWFLALGTALAMGSFQTITISLVPIAQEGGVDVRTAASLLSMLGAMAIVGKVVLVWVGDKFDKALALAVMFAVLSVVVFTLTIADSYLALLACSALLGLGVGATMPVFLALMADYVGALSFGSANGLAMFLMSVCGAIGMRFGGEVYDRTGGYDVMFVTFACLCLVSTVLLLMCRHFSRKSAPAAVANVPAS